MKSCIFLAISVIQVSISFSQIHFVISGKTNLALEGKAILIRSAPEEFYSSKIKSDTVQISNYSFVFYGLLKCPELYRLRIIGNNRDYITEPFFADTGFQKISTDSTSQVNDVLDFGYGISMHNSKANDEYTKRYLPLFDEINRTIDTVFSEVDRCDTISNSETKKACIINTELERANIRKNRDGILLNYAMLHPNSSIIPWLLYESIRLYGYTEYYQKTFEQVANYISQATKASLNNFLITQKTKAVGSSFPLIDFVSSNTPKDFIKKNKYTLIDFWFSNCHPCLAQFKLLKNVYEKNTEKGFDMVAISIDGEDALSKYENVLKLNNYPWKQILDTSGVKAKSINISKYPTNFLLDNKGKIISVDINLYVLDDFLEKNL